MCSSDLGDETPDQRGAAGKRLLHHLTTEYPLQPFSSRYFDAGDDRLFTYSKAWARAHGEISDAQHENTLPPPPALESTLDLKALTRFLKNPSQHFLNQRLNVYFERGDTLGEDDERFEFSNLDVYKHGDKVFESLDALTGDPDAGTFKREIGRAHV